MLGFIVVFTIRNLFAYALDSNPQDWGDVLRIHAHVRHFSESLESLQLLLTIHTIHHPTNIHAKPAITLHAAITQPISSSAIT